MKKTVAFVVVLVLIFALASCGHKEIAEDTKEPVEITPATGEVVVMSEGDPLTLTGVVDYSDEPSDIGREYCIVAGEEEHEYYFDAIDNEKSKWSSATFYTRDKDDTELLRAYVGKKVTVSGIFATECHGVPYITKVTVSDAE